MNAVREVHSSVWDPESTADVPSWRDRPTSTRPAGGDREQDGVGRRDRDQDWRALLRTYLAPLAHAPVVIRRGRLPQPSAQQPPASRVSAFSWALRCATRLPVSPGYGWLPVRLGSSSRFGTR